MQTQNVQVAALRMAPAAGPDRFEPSQAGSGEPQPAAALLGWSGIGSSGGLDKAGATYMGTVDRDRPAQVTALESQTERPHRKGGRDECESSVDVRNVVRSVEVAFV